MYVEVNITEQFNQKLQYLNYLLRRTVPSSRQVITEWVPRELGRDVEFSSLNPLDPLGIPKFTSKGGFTLGLLQACYFSCVTPTNQASRHGE